MTVTSIEHRRGLARRKLALAVATLALSLIAFAVHLPLVGTVGLGVSAYLAYRWLRFRVARGLRF